MAIGLRTTPTEVYYLFNFRRSDIGNACAGFFDDTLLEPQNELKKRNNL